MLGPVLARPSRQFREAKHPLDIGEVIRERLPSQTANILYQERFRPKTRNRADRIREKVSVVSETTMFPANTPWLARYASRQKIDVFGNAVEIERPNIGFLQIPVCDVLQSEFLIQPDGFACVAIQLNNGIVMEASL
jgi:hypothetical protein